MTRPYVRCVTAGDRLRFPGTAMKIASADQYVLWHRMVIAEAGDLVRPWESPAPLVAWIDWGNWAVRCSHCRAGLYTHPAWTIACCTDCGAIHRNVVVPANYADIEKVLCERADRTLHTWLPHESIDDLRAQNAQLAAEAA
jgi:hypothetical protein